MADDRVTSLEQLMTLGREMGYSDEGLRKFIEGQQKVEREERAERRRAEAEAENRKMESEMENRKIEAEMENRKIEAENRKLEAEMENRKMESEMENRKMESEMENRKIEAEMENRKMEAEMENRKMEAEMEKLRLETRLREKELEIQRLGIESEDSDAPSSIPGHHRPNHAPRPQLPKFSEGSDSMDAYISRFEVFARSQGWPEREWAMILSALLTGKALNIFSTLPAVQQSDFDCLKKALLQGFDLTEEAFRKKFRSVRLQAGETYIQFGARLEHYFQKWLELSGTGEEFLELKELILREQVLTGCGPELTIHLRERQPKTTAELLQMAEIYREARADTKSCVRQVSSTGERGDKKPDELPRKSAQSTKGVSEQRSLGQREIRECFLCHKRGHIARDCRTRVQRAAAMERTTECRVERPVVKEGVRDGEEEVQPVASTVEQAVSGVQDIGILGSLPVEEGWIGQCKVKVLRDTGCSCGVVKASLVKEEDLTGQVQTCTLIDGTKREFPVAELVVQTPYFSGKLSALVMESPIYDLIVGNVPGARDPGDPLLLTAETAAVQTRSHRAEKGVKPLLVSARKAGIEASPEEVRKAQEGDPSLEKLWKLARGEKRQEVRGGKADFQVKNGLLHRMFTKTKTGKVTSQLVVPACFRETVMSVGHESLMAGHLGISKTADRVLSSFHWPGAMADLKRYCASCDACQRSATRVSQKRQFDKRVRRQNLKQGDKVLLLLPTDHNKILMHWKGPFDITEKVSHQDYRIDVNGKQKLFHANLLRKYTQRESQPATLAAVIDGGEGDPEVEGEILIPEFRSGETYRDVSLHEGLSGDKKEEARRLLRQFSESLTDKPGKTTLETYTVELTTKQPVHVKAYPIPYATRQVVEEEVEKMLELGVIEPSRSPYSAPVVIVRKKSGEHRFCVDYRRLNNVTKVDAEVIPNVEDLFAQISTPKSKYFTRIDLSKGYWQIALSEDSKEATAFSTPTGLFQWRVLPFGMVNAPAVFTRMMRKLLKGLKGVENFMDDILIASETWEEHMSQLAEVLLRLRRANLTARPTKCQIGYPDLEFLGFVVGENTKQPEKSKIEQMLSSARPKSKTEVRSLLGLIGFYREFVPNFAAITSPLSDLTKKGQPPVVQWTEAAEKALKTVKERLGTYPILKLPDMSKQFTLRTDASGVGLGAVLLQEYDGQKFPVKYASRKLSKCEQGYATVETECLAVVWGVQKFQKYLYGNQFTIETDHQPLTFLQEARLKNSRVLRWAMALQPYRYHIDYIPGRENVGADYLSRVM
ncbi:hypothetical protein ACOMHN_034000 [Nucella lapillus]